ncbi:MarR family winged helix-turn-helix transcriptional regulator [Levilactobacillus suantsaii]|uniref:MarR family winged helix-turn-helix transcriptional regulator n=1 Tax=Levilactobacillus suantsaii TaxID=2292255 RepID=UPI001482440B|nr:MarR family transcriptional regulator [Levilactobacillus suantsaii]QMU08528.1 winged helix DNA-binding protein [Levilactobacillus suantsaii]
MKNHDYGFLAQVLARGINQYFSQIGAKLNLSGMEIVILNFFFDNYQTTVYQTDIEREFNIRSSTATANIRIMVQKELLQQTVDPNDKRRKQLSLTHKSMQLETQLNASKERLEQALLTGMPTSQQQTFLASLELAIKNLHSFNTH